MILLQSSETSSRSCQMSGPKLKPALCQMATKVRRNVLDINSWTTEPTQTFWNLGKLAWLLSYSLRIHLTKFMCPESFSRTSSRASSHRPPWHHTGMNESKNCKSYPQTCTARALLKFPPTASPSVSKWTALFLLPPLMSKRYRCRRPLWQIQGWSWPGLMNKFLSSLPS